MPGMSPPLEDKKVEPERPQAGDIALPNDLPLSLAEFARHYRVEVGGRSYLRLRFQDDLDIAIAQSMFQLAQERLMQEAMLSIGAQLAANRPLGVPDDEEIPELEDIPETPLFDPAGGGALGNPTNAEPLPPMLGPAGDYADLPPLVDYDGNIVHELD